MNDEIKVNARAGCQLGTRCPAPLTVTNVNPLYPSTYPPTCHYYYLVTFQKYYYLVYKKGHKSAIFSKFDATIGLRMLTIFIMY